MLHLDCRSCIFFAPNGCVAVRCRIAGGVASGRGAAVRSRRSGLRFSVKTTNFVAACPASASISGCVRRLSYACKPSLLTHGTPRPCARSFPDFGHALAIRPLNGVYCLAGPRDNSSPYPCRISRFGRSKCDWGWESGLSEGPYFISMPTSLGLRTTFFGSIFAMWSFAAEPSP